MDPFSCASGAAAGPVIALVAGIYVLAIMAMGNPGARWVTIVSMLPPTAPIIMPLRAALVTVPAWQVVAAAILMLAAICLLFLAGGRLYQYAVLHLRCRCGRRDVVNARMARGICWSAASGSPVYGVMACQ